MPGRGGPEVTTEPIETESPPADVPARELGPSSRRFSLTGRMTAIVIGGMVLFVILMLVGEAFLPGPRWLGWLLAFGLSFVTLVSVVRSAVHPLQFTIDALSDGIRSFHDRDFSMRLAHTRRDELGDLVDLYNEVGKTLQEERRLIRQRELLLQTALDQSPIAIVLVNPLTRVVYANQEARRLLLGGSKLEGRKFDEILASCPDEMRIVLDSEADGIFTVEEDDNPETYHVSQRTFFLNRFRHTLYLLRRMTPELARQEAEIWKKVIRVISHELNNSLAPISSLAHSGLKVAQQGDGLERLEPIYDSIRERVEHLTGFLEGYARFARLPPPARQLVDWSDWLEGPRELFAFEIEGELPSAPGWFDPSQLQQVLINLLKNAVEASDDTPRIRLRVERVAHGGNFVQITDEGAGMPDRVLRKALLPFYSTKQTGSGVGLPLCREIVEAHGGHLRIQSREGAGTMVSFWLPARPASGSREPASSN